MQWLLDHGADANAQTGSGRIPLYVAAYHEQPEAVQVLLEHHPDMDSQIIQDTFDEAFRSAANSEGKVVDIMRRLMEHGAGESAEVYVARYISLKSSNNPCSLVTSLV